MHFDTFGVNTMATAELFVKLTLSRRQPSIQALNMTNKSPLKIRWKKKLETQTILKKKQMFSSVRKLEWRNKRLKMHTDDYYKPMGYVKVKDQIHGSNMPLKYSSSVIMNEI